MKAEIITIGTELLMGFTIDTNSAEISKALETIGIGTYYKQTVGDNADRIREALTLAQARSELIILCGGIGPTDDDITREVLAAFLGQDLVIDQGQMAVIEAYFAQKGSILTPNNRKQAQHLTGGEILPNDRGLALGEYYRDETRPNRPIFVLLPGPPHEMRWMLNHYLLERLRRDVGSHRKIVSEYLNFTGIGEATLANKIETIVREQTNPTIAIYAKDPLIVVRITAEAGNEEEGQARIAGVRQSILESLADYYVTNGEHFSLEKGIIHRLQVQRKQVVLAESVTGGRVLADLTHIPGASQVIMGGYVTYQVAAKQGMLGIAAEILDRHSVVSAEVAQAMAQAALSQTGADIALSLTGVAGPTILEGHPVGEVYIGLALKDGPILSQVFHFQAQDREEIRTLAKNEALKLLLAHLK